MKTNNKTKNQDLKIAKLIPLNIIIGKNERGGLYAHCLDFDIILDPYDDNDNSLSSAIKSYITFTIENNNLENVFKLAPIDLYNKLFKTTQTSFRRLFIDDFDIIFEMHIQYVN